MFSRWCVDLHWTDVGSREELEAVLRGSYNRRTTVVQLGGKEPVADWSGFITPFLNTMEGHLGPHLFGFTRAAGAVPQMRTKLWARGHV